MVVQSLDGDLRRGGPLLGESPGEPPREVGRLAGTMGKGRSENERSRGAGEREGALGKEAAGGGSSAAVIFFYLVVHFLSCLNFLHFAI